MFPDSKIASGYLIHPDKTRYIIVYKLALFGKEFIINDAKNKCFSNKFGETTAPKIEKQCDGSITYFINFFIQWFYFHWTLYKHFSPFVDSLSISTSCLINIGMDGPTVKQSFLK